MLAHLATNESEKPEQLHVRRSPMAASYVEAESESDDTIMHTSEQPKCDSAPSRSFEPLLRCDMSAAEPSEYHEEEEEEDGEEEEGEVAPEVSSEQRLRPKQADQLGCGTNCTRQPKQASQNVAPDSDCKQQIQVRKRRPSSVDDNQVQSIKKAPVSKPARNIEVRLLVRRREAGALIGKRGANIKRMREQFKEASFNIPDTGNGPERVACIATNSLESLDSILTDVTQLFQEKQQQQQQQQQYQNQQQQSNHSGQLTRRLSSSTSNSNSNSNSSSSTLSTAAHTSSSNNESEQQIEMKLLINSSHAGLLIGLGGQSIRKLRNVSVPTARSGLTGPGDKQSSRDSRPAQSCFSPLPSSLQIIST